MKKQIGFILLLLITLLPATSFAATFRAGDQVSIPSNQEINNNLYLAGGSVTDAGTITGDLVAAGGTVVVSGPVSADVAAAGGNVTLVGPVGGDVRAAGGSVTIQNTIGGDLVVGGGQITVGGNGVGGDVAIAGGTVAINAPITRNVQIQGGSVYLNAPIGGNITINADTVTLGSNAVISGTLTYSATSELTREEGAQLIGTVNYEPKPIETSTEAVGVGTFAAIISIFVLVRFFALLISALLLGLLLKRYSDIVIHHAISRPLFEIGRGLLIAITLPIVSVLLLFTGIGIPLGIVGLLGFVILMIASWIVAPIILGSWIYDYLYKTEREVSWKTILLGVVVYSILGLLPIVGWIVQVILGLLAIGAMSALKLEVLKEWR